MVGIKLYIKNSGVAEEYIFKYWKEVAKIHYKLHEKKDEEKEFLGWL